MKITKSDFEKYLKILELEDELELDFERPFQTSRRLKKLKYPTLPPRKLEYITNRFDILKMIYKKDPDKLVLVDRNGGISGRSCKGVQEE